MKQQLDRVHLKNIKVPIHITQPVLDKIQYLNRSVPKLEWSGVLFYEVTGSIQKPEEMSINLLDVLPMDVGTKGHTEYQLDNRFVEFLMEDEQRFDWKVGHIHSHNDMPVFFSGEDEEELEDSSPQHNFYLSLIVNNYLDMSAKIAFIGKVKQSLPNIPLLAKDENGNDYTIETRNFEINKTVLYTYDCNIDLNLSNIEVPEDFASKVSGIISKRENSLKPALQNNISRGKGWQRENYPSGRIERKPIGQQPLSNRHAPAHHIEMFAISLFKPIGSVITIEDVIEEELDILEELMVPGDVIANNLLDEYADAHKAWFPGADEKDFVYNTKEVIKILEDQVPSYPFLRPTVVALEQMLKNFKHSYGNTFTTS